MPSSWNCIISINIRTRIFDVRCDVLGFHCNACYMHEFQRFSSLFQSMADWGQPKYRINRSARSSPVAIPACTTNTVVLWNNTNDNEGSLSLIFHRGVKFLFNNIILVQTFSIVTWLLGVGRILLPPVVSQILGGGSAQSRVLEWISLFNQRQNKYVCYC